MKKTLKYLSIVLTALLLFSCTDTLSDIQTKSFIKFFGSYQVDVGKDLQVLPAGGYALTGRMIPESTAKMVLIITDEYGNQEISSPNYYGDNYRTEGESLLLLDDGYLIAGQIYDTLVNGSLQSDIFLVRTDSKGIPVWTSRYGGLQNESVSHIVKRSTGGYTIAGKRNQNDQDDIWIVMVDEDGKQIFELSGNDKINDDEALFLHNTGSGYLVACTYDDGAYAGSDMLLLYIDSACNVIDTKSLGTNFDDDARSIIPFNGAYLMMGNAQNTTTGFRQVEIYSFSLESGFIKNLQDFATISMPGTDLEGEACAVTSKGHMAVIGTLEVNENRDMLLLIVDNEGNLIVEADDNQAGIQTYGDLGSQSGSAVRRSLDGGLIMVGSNSLEGNSVISLVKTNAKGKF